MTGPCFRSWTVPELSPSANLSWIHCGPPDTGIMAPLM